MADFEQKILIELQALRAEIVALRENYSLLQVTYFENLSPSAPVGVDYAAFRFGCSEAAVIRGRFGTDKIPRLRNKPIAFQKKDVDAAFKNLTKSPSEKAAQYRHRAKNKK